MPNEMPGAGMLVQTNMGTPTVGLNQGPNWSTGSSMLGHTVVPLIPSVAFNSRGRGVQSLTLEGDHGPRLSGVRGTLDLLLIMGASGTARTICVLTDNPSSPTKYIAIKIDTSNRPFVIIKDSLGTTVAQVGPNFAAIPAGQTVSVRMAWDSQNIVDAASTRRATFKVNRDAVASSDWTTNPTANWTSFQPTHVMLGASLGDADFNGTVSAVQLSNVVSP